MDSILDFLKNLDWATVSSNVVVIGLIAWAAIKLFSKSFIDSMGEKTAELFTTKQKTMIEETIKSEFSTALEKLKSDLEKKNIAFEIDYTFFNSQRSKVCLEWYWKMEEFYLSAVAFRKLLKDHSIPNIEKKFNEYNEHRLELETYYSKNRILLPDDLWHQSFEFARSIQTLYVEFEPLIKKRNERYDLDEYDRIQDIIKEIIKYEDEMDKIVERLRKLVQPVTE